MKQTTRSEEEIFSDISLLCGKSGYAHVVAYFCYRDNTIQYQEIVSPEDMLHQFSSERLLRTEISTIIGLLIKQDIDFSLPKPYEIQSMINETDHLMGEFHASMGRQFFTGLTPESIKDPNFNPFENGSILRESIFYGGESAHISQYRDLSAHKYVKDQSWFQENKGYLPEEAKTVIEAITYHQSEKLIDTIHSFNNKPPDEWTILPAFLLTAEEISIRTGISCDVVNRILESFSLENTVNNQGFNSVGDFNEINAYPIIKYDKTNYLIFQPYSLAEAFYETPFFWFKEDNGYKAQAMANRGDFTEEFSEEKLIKVFGKNNVYSNLDIVDKKGNKAGEIDVLVTFSDRAIILQAKSKKLTLASRKGNDQCLRDDFKKAIQSAYDQAFSCSHLLEDESYRLVNSDSQEITINREFKKIYPFCVISEHYPALSFQSRQFLKYEKTEKVMPPFVMDVFLLDVMSEFLDSPLYFLSYIDRRVLYSDKVMAAHELTILSYHLKYNLWMDGEFDMFHLGDDIAIDLDIAMMVRREGIEGSTTPEGILTKFVGTPIGDLISQISKHEDAATINLGFMLLQLSEDTINQLNKGIDHISRLCKKDGKCHDLTISLDGGSTGLTIHCNNDSIHVAGPRLEGHAEKRKYSQKARGWFGICIEPEQGRLKFGVEIDYDWVQSDELDEIVKSLPKAQRNINFGTKVKGRKIRRNEPCPCGSGIKYKKCCLT